MWGDVTKWMVKICISLLSIPAKEMKAFKAKIAEYNEALDEAYAANASEDGTNNS